MREESEREKERKREREKEGKRERFLGYSVFYLIKKDRSNCG